jgi:hypothetical protein
MNPDKHGHGAGLMDDWTNGFALERSPSIKKQKSAFSSVSIGGKKYNL